MFKWIENYMEKMQMNRKRDDGWAEQSDESEQELQMIKLYSHNKGRGILEQQYSLQPDMISGWMPKLPSCPIPLTYQNVRIDCLLLKVAMDERYRIVYRGPRYINSVQMHKNYSYRWKYREKYELKVNAIVEAVQQVGKHEFKPSPIYSSLITYQKEPALQFSSQFEGGNLDLAIKVRPFQYDLFIRSDTNTRGHTNWYYFKINNYHSVGTFQLNLCNITKNKNLYNKGMTPYTRANYSKDSEAEWRQNQCKDVNFVERMCRYGRDGVQTQLQLTYEFKESHMEVEFAYAIPYTYSDLQSYLSTLSSNPLVKTSSLCQSFSGLELPLLTISSSQFSPKNNIVIISRIHPGESNSSHMIEGFINALLEQDNASSQRLLSMANFYIVPMFNPDGVVAGNYRTSFSGRDLNRGFQDIGNFRFPQINGLVDFIKRLKFQNKKVEFFFDFHSHSSKKDLFAYGPEHIQGSLYYFRSRILAKIFQKQDPMFSYQKSIFTISQHKKSTARSYMLRKQRIPMSYTFEISNGIYSLSKDAEDTYDKKSLLKAGKIILSGLAQYFTQYHREIRTNHIPSKIRALKLKEDKHRRSSSKDHQRYRKSVGVFKSQDFFEKQNDNIDELKILMKEIIQDKKTQDMKHEEGSDSEESEHDVKDQELNNLFMGRKKYHLKQEEQKESQNAPQKTLQRTSLKKIKSKKEFVKLNSSTRNLSQKQNAEHSISATTLNKYKRNRIYYEETHPRVSKKVYDNPFDSKKPLKQKKFPILF